MNIPSQYQVRCPLCGSLLDLRDLNQVMGHEWNAATGKCVDVVVTSGFVSFEKIRDSAAWKNDRGFHSSN